MNPDGVIYLNETEIGNFAWSKIYDNDSGTIINIYGMYPAQIAGLPLVFKRTEPLEFSSTGIVEEITRDSADGSWTIGLNNVTDFNTTVDDIILALSEVLPVSGNNTITNNDDRSIYINDSNINNLGEFEFLDILSRIYIPNAGPYINHGDVDENGKELYVYNTYLTDTAWERMSECGYWTYNLNYYPLQIRLIYLSEFSTYTPDVIITTSNCFDKFNSYIDAGYDTYSNLIELSGYYRSGDDFPRNIITFLQLYDFADLKFPNIVSIRNRKNNTFYNIVNNILNDVHDGTSELNFICGASPEADVFPNIYDFNSGISYSPDINDTIGYMESDSGSEYNPTDSEWLSMNNLTTTNIEYNCLNNNMDDLFRTLEKLYPDEMFFPSNNSTSYSETKVINLDLEEVYYPNYASSDSICSTVLYDFVWLPDLGHPHNDYGIYPVNKTSTTNSTLYGTVC